MIVELNTGGVRPFSDAFAKKVELLSPGHRDSQLIFKVALSASVRNRLVASRNTSPC